MRMNVFPTLILLGAAALPGVFEAAPASREAHWNSDVRTTFAAARKSGKPILVDLYAEWCGWCKVLDAKVFSTPEFTEFAREFELLRVDVEDGGEGSELAARYDSSSLPTMLVLSPAGAQIGEVVGFAETEVFLSRIRGAFAIHERELETYARALVSADPGEVKAVASAFYRRYDGERAAALFARRLELGAAPALEEAWLRFYRANALRIAGRFAESRTAARAAATAAAGIDDGALRERLDLLPFWIARDEDRCGEAADVLAGFESRHPKSTLLAGARNAIDRLKSTGISCS